jgi:endonuclease YncB( thermonuclease family)
VTPGRLPALAVVASLAATAGAVAQGTPYPGPYLGKVIRVIDGDNFEAEFGIWPSIRTIVSVRIAGIDAPETHRPACEAERLFGALAARRLSELLPVGTEVRITDVRADTFAGRVVAEADRLVDRNYRGLAVDLLALRVEPVGAVALPWDGAQPGIDWCARFAASGR